jgi:hypothetical protein
MPANITFTEFTDREIVWANVEAINTFFESITVPDATEDSAGVMTMVEAISSLSGVSIDNDYYTINVMEADGSSSSYDVVLKSTVDTIRTRLVTIEDALNLMRANMIEAGIMYEP